MTSTLRTRPRRKSDNVGDIYGDTGVPALSTLHPAPPTSYIPSPPLSPRPSQTSQSKPPRRSKRRKVRSAFRRWKDISFRHTWLNPAIALIILLSAYFVYPDPSNPMYSAIFLSYALPANHPLIPAHARNTKETYYGKGAQDFAFVAFYIVVLSFTREFLMQRILRPLAIYFGVKSRGKQNRFMEQAYTAWYFAIFGPFGLYVMSRTPVWYFNTERMYEDFPHRSHDAAFKTYYLLQASYWAQQAIVLMLQLEKPRKDFKELVGHHIVTVALIWCSYRFHFTYMGLAVYITHDISDFFLATSKVLNYIQSPITTVYFSFFICTWAYLRHWINLRVLYSVLTTFKTIGPFELNWETQQYKCWIAQYIAFLLLAALQSLNLFWMYLILRIAYHAIWTQPKDDRSDEEDDEAEEAARKEEKARLEELKMLKLNGGSVRAANGHAREEHESYADAVVEGKKAI